MSEDNSEQSIDKSNDPNQQQLQGYNFMKTLGKGNFGKVKLGIHILTGQYVAIKILQKDLIFEKADIERISRQIKIMKLIRHKNIIQLYEIIQKPKRLYLIMQYADGGDLFDMIVKNEKLDEKNALNYFAQILLGLEYLHGKGVAHRDMKPENILISKGKIKIADFGLGNFFAEGELLRTACGSPCYASPEMLHRVPYNPQKIDIWSSGIILYAMVCGYLPFQDQITNKLYQKIKTNNPRYPKFLSENLKTILKKVLDKNPETRSPISQLKTIPSIKTQFQLEQVNQFDIDINKLNKICEIYGISQQEKLVNYLRKNKHNNLTTIYYLATKGKSDGDKGKGEIQKEQEKEKERDSGEKKVNYVETRQNRRGSTTQNYEQQDAKNQKQATDSHDITSQTSINQPLKQQKIPLTKPPTPTPQSPQSQLIFAHTESIIENPNDAIEHNNNKIKEVEKNETNTGDSNNSNKKENVQGRSSKLSSIKGEISFSQLEEFSNQTEGNIDKQSITQSNIIQKQQKILNLPQPQHQPQPQPQPQHPNPTKTQPQSPQKQSKITQIDKKQVHRVLTNQTQPMIIINQDSFTTKDKINKSGKKPEKIEKKVSLNQSQRIEKDKEKIRGSGKGSMNTTGRFQKDDHPRVQEIKGVNQVKVQKQPTSARKTQNIKKRIEKKQSEKEPEPNKYPINKKQDSLKNSEQIKTKDSPSIIKAKSKQEQQKKPDLKNSSKDLQKYFSKKPRLVKTGRMEMVRSGQQQPNRKAPPLYERSHSRDKNITTKKIIGKLVNTEPFLLDASKLVLCPWPIFSSILIEKGAEGRIEYFSYGKTCIYIAKSSLKGIRNLRQLIQKINAGEIQ